MGKENDKGIDVNPTYLEWILQAVHKIKYQKQRPGIERIQNAIRQNHAVSNDSIKEQLELAVKCGKIIKVFSCDDYTYKDPAMAPGTPVARPKSSISNNRWPNGKPGPKPGTKINRSWPNGKPGPKPGSINISKKTDFLKAVIQCLKEANEPKGMSLRSIDKFIKSKHGDEMGSAALTKNIRLTVRRAMQYGQLVQSGKLIKLPNKSSSLALDETDPDTVILPFERNKVITSYIKLIMCLYINISLFYAV